MFVLVNLNKLSAFDEEGLHSVLLVLRYDAVEDDIVGSRNYYSNSKFDFHLQYPFSNSWPAMLTFFLNVCCSVLLEGIKYYAKEPKGLGRAFLRMVWEN